MRAPRRRAVMPMYADDVELFTLDDGGFSTLTPAGVAYLTDQYMQEWTKLCPRRFRDAALDSVTPDGGVRADVDRWVANVVDGTCWNLLVFGPVGTGKTHLALAAAREVFMQGWSALFVPVVDMLDALRPGGEPEVTEYGSPAAGSLGYYQSPDVLVLDDLGGEKASDWTFERLYAVLNKRWLEERPTVATTNLEPAELREAIGDRSYDRLRDSAVAVHLGGASRRLPL